MNEIEIRIEKLKKQLSIIIERTNYLSDDELLNISQELDNAILDYIYEKIKND